MTVNDALIAIVALVVGLGAGWLLFKRRQLSFVGVSQLSSRASVTVFVVLSLLLVGGAGWLASSFTKGATPDPEIMMGLMIVGAITALMSVLFILAAGFNSMNLTDGKQPLGLPEGSIRAMIALVLIMIFIIFGIYLFRMVGSGASTFVGRFPKVPDPKAFGDRLMTFEANSDSTFTVWVLSPVTDDGRRLAQQLVTTVGTLVVAVAGFYFGSTSVGSALAAGQAMSGPSSSPEIRTITPVSGTKGQQAVIEIAGTGLNAVKDVRLVRGDESIHGRDILSSDSRIRFTVDLNKDPGAKWDVVVENSEGKQARLPSAFSID